MCNDGRDNVKCVVQEFLEREYKLVLEPVQWSAPNSMRSDVNVVHNSVRIGL